MKNILHAVLLSYMCRNENTEISYTYWVFTSIFVWLLVVSPVVVSPGDFSAQLYQLQGIALGKRIDQSIEQLLCLIGMAIQPLKESHGWVIILE